MELDRILQGGRGQEAGERSGGPEDIVEERARLTSRCAAANDGLQGGERPLQRCSSSGAQRRIGQAQLQTGLSLRERISNKLLGADEQA